MIVKIFAAPIDYDLNSLYTPHKNEFLIGVDKGAYHALKHGLELDLAIGDFDSVNENEHAYINKHAKMVKTHEVKKNKTDSDLAISEALKMNATRIIMYGGIGNRLDHTYGNIMFLKRGNITVMNNHVKMFILSPGTYGITHRHEYISFFAVEDVKQLTLEGFAYPLKDYHLTKDDPLCISNKGQGVVSFTEGKLLVIQADD